MTVVYEYMFRSLWLVSSQTWLPNMEIFMLRIFMFLFVGMSCLWWIWRKEVRNVFTSYNTILHIVVLLSVFVKLSLDNSFQF